MGEARRKAKLNGGATNSSRHDHFGDFVHAVRSGKAAKLIFRVGLQNYTEYLTLADKKNFDFDAPSYNFGDFLYSTDDVTLEALYGHAEALAACGDLRLPNAHCFFLYSIQNDPRPNVVVEAREEDGRIGFFMWSRNEWDEWTWENACVTYARADNGTIFSAMPGSEKNYSIFFKSSVKTTLIAMAALATKLEENIIELDEFPAQVTTARGNRLGLTHPTRLIRLQKGAVERLKAIAARTARPVSPLVAKGGVGCCPHNRRGHERVYKKTGKRIWINETKIKGGSPVPRPAVVQVLH